MTTGAISAVRGQQTIQLPIKAATQQTGAVAFAGSSNTKSARNGASNSNGLVTCGLIIGALVAAAAYFMFGGSKKSEDGDGEAAS